MYRLTLFICTVTVLTCPKASAQDGDYSLGARNAALSGASITHKDSWSVFNSTGAFGSAEETSAFVSYQNRYNIAGFHVIGGGFVYHSTWLNAGVKYFKFGDNLFNQQTTGIVLANRFQMVSLGLGVNVVQTSAEGLQTRRKVALEFGGVAEINQILSFGAHIFNIKHGELYPTTMKAGISLNPVKPLKINVEIEKQLETKEKLKTGLEYQIIEKLFLRTGISIQGNNLGYSEVKSTYGFGFVPAAFNIDYAFSNDSRLGAVHEISLTYQIKKP